MPEDGVPDSGITALMAAATSLHELFATYVAAGFTEAQALYLIGQILAAAARPAIG